MATQNLSGLFNLGSPEKIERDYLNQFLVSPAQMGQQGLLQQVVSQMSNAGANIGASGARMLGGRLPEVLKKETIDKAFQEVKALNLPNNSSIYAELGKRLSSAGYNAEAALAGQEAAKYQQQELAATKTGMEIEGLGLSNTLNRSTLIPKVQAALLANATALAALDKSKQDYDLASKINPTKVAQAKQALATAQQAYAQTDKTNPIALSQAKLAVAAAQQAYAQANRINPLEVQKAQQAIINSQQVYAQTNAQMAQFNALSPGVIEQAALETQAQQMSNNKEVSLTAARQIMSEFPQGSPESNAALNNILAIESPSSLTPKPVNFGTDREAYSSAMYGGKPFKDLTPTEQADVNLKLKEKSITVARAGAYELGKDLTAFDKAVEKPTISFQAAKTAKTLLREAKASNNPDAWNGGIVSTARAITIGKLSDADIRRYGGSPEIVQSVKDLASKAFTGIPTIDTQNKLYAVLSIIERAAADEINRQSNRFTAAAAEAGFSKDPEVYFPKVTADGVVSWKDL